MTTIERLEKLGLHSAAAVVREKALLRTKLHKAYDKYEFVTIDQVTEFNQKLKEKAGAASRSGSYTYPRLALTPLTVYRKVPPAGVLDKLESAIADQCFDTFEVAHMVTEEVVPDPILFGVINGCTDRFFIDQWDNDVTIEAIREASNVVV